MIPNIFHFIFGLEKDFGHRPFSICHYLSIKSAYEINKPDKINLYYKYQPTGIWWTRALEYINPVPISVPRQIFGNKLYHYAHKADVIRLMILLKFGGVYLDIDTICVKPLNSFYKYDCVLGQEKWNGNVTGLCNALIIASKDNPFIKNWLNSYQFFRSKGRDKYWTENSVFTPLRLAELFPNLIHVEEESSFYYPSWQEDSLKMLFEESVNFPDAYIFHLWETFSYNPYISKLSAESIENVDTTYNLIARKFL